MAATFNIQLPYYLRVFQLITRDTSPYLSELLENRLPKGPDDMSAHIKASSIGISVTIPIKNYRLNLDT